MPFEVGKIRKRLWKSRLSAGAPLIMQGNDEPYAGINQYRPALWLNCYFKFTGNPRFCLTYGGFLTIIKSSVFLG